MEKGKIRKKKMENLSLAFKFLFLSAIFFMSFSIISAADSQSYCCEKTVNGAWCDNQPQANCDPAFKMAPTSCDFTSFCKKGCCYDSQEGLCMESTPQRVCMDSGATWADNAKCNVPQCQLGCCVLADQGAFVTMARCKSLAGFYGIKADFRKEITNEVTCIATAGGTDKGACVYEDSQTFQKTCTFTTRSQCSTASQTSETVNVNDSSIPAAGNSTAKKNQTAPPGFYKDVLCSAEELGTNCGSSTRTMLIPGKDEVYFQDTCGNPANIYDASRYKDKQYWKKVFKKSQSCGYSGNNAGSSSCGNCDYYYGSIGRPKSIRTGNPTYGDYICIDLNCKKEGKKHGESWCAKDTPNGDGLDTVGSRYYKEVCIYGEVLTEPCADYRNEICIQGTFGSFSEAACRVNRWQDCNKQQQQSDCENTDQRDCMWIDGYYFSAASSQIERSTNDSNYDGSNNDPTPSGLCMPNYPPGVNFWGASSAASSSGTGNFSATTPAFGTGYVNSAAGSTTASDKCSMGNAKITFKWTRVTRPAVWKPLEGILGDKEEAWACDQTTGNCQYMSAADVRNANLSEATIKKWAADMNELCYKLSDCGGYINWQGKYTEDGFAAYFNNRRVAGSGGSEIMEATKPATSSASASTAASSGSSASSSSGLDQAVGVANAATGVANALKQ